MRAGEEDGGSTRENAEKNSRDRSVLGNAPSIRRGGITCGYTPGGRGIGGWYQDDRKRRWVQWKPWSRMCGKAGEGDSLSRIGPRQSPMAVVSGCGISIGRWMTVKGWAPEDTEVPTDPYAQEALMELLVLLDPPEPIPSPSFISLWRYHILIRPPLVTALAQFC